MIASAAGFESLPAAASTEEAPVSSVTATLGKSKIEIMAHKWFILIFFSFFVGRLPNILSRWSALIFYFFDKIIVFLLASDLDPLLVRG